MIGFDLDGVFINDMSLGNCTIEEFLNIRNDHPMALFQPRGKYVIITGRPVSDVKLTMAWISKSLDNKPETVYHGNKDWANAAEYKADTIRQLGLKMFVESCAEQARYIQGMCPQTKVVVFPDFVSMQIQKLYEEMK